MTQSQQILGVLGDGQWHSSRAIHRSVFCVLHSRIAELRRRGYTIDHRGGGAGAENHEYRLVGVPEEAAAAAPAGRAAASSDIPARSGPPSSADWGDGMSEPVQLELA